jgi:hypothetical protein
VPEHADHAAHVVHMLTMGLLVSAVAPMLARAARYTALDRHAPPAVAALPAFAVLHAAVTVAGDGLLAQAVLLAAAVVFWMPVLGTRRRLPDAGRAVYLFLAGPLLDLAGVWLVATGDGPGGLAMIVGMLPIGVAAIVVTWRWITSEERARAAVDAPLHHH